MSQYKDLITGDVIYNIRTKGNSLVDISPYVVKSKEYWYNTGTTCALISSDITKFSDTSLYQRGSQINIYKNLNNFNSSKFTISFWCNPYYIQSHGASFADMFWAGIDIGFDIDLLIAVDTSDTNSRAYTHFELRKSYSDIIILQQVRNSLIPLNQWYHYAITYDGTTYKMYENGTLVVSANSGYKFDNSIIAKLAICAGRQELQVYYDDIVFISDQILWEDEFVPPNMYLTGYEMPKRIPHRNILLPEGISGNDYFDKAFLY